MLDLLLLATMLLVCGGIGLPIAQLLPERFRWRLLVAPSLGVGVLAVLVPIAYRAGASISVFFFASATVAVAAIAWRAWPTWQSIRAGFGNEPDERRLAITVAVTCVLATLVLLAPRWLGGEQFSVFQGNQWDTFGYLESALVYARQPYSYVAAVSDGDTVRTPILAMASEQLNNRPSVHQLYSAFSRIAPGEAYRLYYPFLVFGFAQLIQVMVFVLRNCFPSMSRAAWLLVPLVFPLGFWGQYVFDINAWSHIMSLPLLAFIFGISIHALARPEEDLRTAARIAGVLATAVAGAAYLYPEGLLVHVAAIGPVAVIAIVALTIHARRLKLAPIVPLLGFGGVGTVVLYGPQLAFLISQVKWSSDKKVPWWQFFQAFFYGRDAKLGHGFAMASDFAGGFFGMYFATPSAGSSMVSETAYRTAIVIAIGGAIAGLVVLIASSLRSTREERLHAALWSGATLVALVPAVRLALDDNYWPAGKIVSFVAPLFMTLLCISAGFASEHRWWPWLRAIVLAFAAFQLGTALARIPASRAPHGIHYAPPYPSVQAIELKRDLVWDLEPLHALSSETKVLLRPMDPWTQCYLMIFLYSRRIPFAIEGRINTYFGWGRELPPAPPPWEPDAQIMAGMREIVVTYRDGRPPLRVASKAE